MRKFLPGFLVIALISSIGGSSWASNNKNKDDDGFIGLGARFSWNNYKTTIMKYDSVDVKPGMSSTDFGSPHFGGEFHWGISRQLVLTAALDLGISSHTIYPYPETGSAGIRSITATFAQIGVMLGTKYYFKKPSAKGVALYISGGIGKYFAKVNNSSTDPNSNQLKSNFYNKDVCEYSTCDASGQKLAQDDLNDLWNQKAGNLEKDWDAAQEADNIIDKEFEMVSKLASPWVAQLALGAEFFATDTFSIGADIFGCRLSFAKADVGKVKGTNSKVEGSATWTGSQTYVNVYLYSALTLNFNLTSGKVSTGDATAEANTGWDTPNDNKQGKKDSWDKGWGNNGWSTGPAAPAPKPASKTVAPSLAPATPETPPAEPGTGNDVPPAPPAPPAPEPEPAPAPAPPAPAPPAPPAN